MEKHLWSKECCSTKKFTFILFLHFGKYVKDVSAKKFIGFLLKDVANNSNKSTLTPKVSTAAIPLQSRLELFQTSTIKLIWKNI